ncbi:GMP reductase 2 isoform X1 [Elgaria multicarinata webbii]|uniref:GMP reductase 2 isoform X1 n=1 Tax=Elgaria multicarinata webbii TaxID=159646 RepID=UPI002FCD554F
MPHIDNDIKLDFKDVLLRPKRSTLKSRSEVDLMRSFVFRNSKQTYGGIPIIAANMDTVGTFEMAKVLCKFSLFTAVHKHYSLDEWKEFAAHNPDCLQNVAASSGTGPSDFELLEQILETVPQVRYICLDVANGYSEHFVQFVKDVRKRFPDHTIMAGNVVTGEMVEELILSGADIIKVGIGPGRRLQLPGGRGEGFRCWCGLRHAWGDAVWTHRVGWRSHREGGQEVQALLRHELRGVDEEVRWGCRRVQGVRGEGRGSAVQGRRGAHRQGHPGRDPLHLHLRGGRQAEGAEPQDHFHPRHPASQPHLRRSQPALSPSPKATSAPRPLTSCLTLGFQTSERVRDDGLDVWGLIICPTHTWCRPDTDVATACHPPTGSGELSLLPTNSSHFMAFPAHSSVG